MHQTPHRTRKILAKQRLIQAQLFQNQTPLQPQQSFPRGPLNMVQRINLHVYLASRLKYLPQSLHLFWQSNSQFLIQRNIVSKHSQFHQLLIFVLSKVSRDLDCRIAPPDVHANLLRFYD